MEVQELSTSDNKLGTPATPAVFFVGGSFQKRICRVPALDPLAGPLSPEERKQRQRLHVKRNYYKKLLAIQAQRDRLQQLEQQYARLVAQKKKHDGTAHSVASPHPAEVDFMSDSDVSADFFTSPFDLGVDLGIDPESDLMSELVGDLEIDGTAPIGDSFRALRELYTEIVIVKEQLLAENESMRQAIAELEAFAQKLALWAKPEEPLPDELPEESVLTALPRLVAPISVDFCTNLALSSLEDMRRYRENQIFITSGMIAFGWRDKRITVEDRVQFSLKKTFHGVTPHELFMRGWGVLSSPKPLAGLFTASLNCQIYPLQVVDDHNKIMLRVMSAHCGMLLVKTAFLVTRFAIPNGYVVFVKSIDPSVVAPQVPTPGTIEKWVEHCTWITFEKVGDDEHGQSCTLEFGGEVQINPMADTSWILEILLIVLRFEGKAHGPMFSIC